MVAINGARFMRGKLLITTDGAYSLPKKRERLIYVGGAAKERSIFQSDISSVPAFRIPIL